MDAGTSTNMCLNNMHKFYRDSGAGKNPVFSELHNKGDRHTYEMETQTEKIIRDDIEDDEYMDEDDPSRFQMDKDMEVVGLDKFLNRVMPRMQKAMDKNCAQDIYQGYDVIWEDDTAEYTELVYKLKTNYDFAEANNATAKTLQMQKEADIAQGIHQQDEFDDDFNDGPPAKREEVKKEDNSNSVEN